MEFIAVTPESELIALNIHAFWGSVACLLFFVVSLFRKKNIRNATIKTVILAVFFLWMTYPFVDRFYALNIQKDHIALGFVWSALDKEIETSDIESITFGVKSKSYHCHIRLNTYSGDNYRSVVLARNAKVCKTKRTELMKRLSLQ